ncbi:Ig-like domain-containing protein, partial [Vibrio alginolyticus]
GNPIEGQVMTASSSSMDVVIDSTNGTTNADGLASFVLTSLKAGDIPVEVEYSGETLTQMVTFVADEATADIALITTEDGASYGSTDGNEVQATITDINDNPLVGQGVTFESDASVTIT